MDSMIRAISNGFRGETMPSKHRFSPPASEMIRHTSLRVREAKFGSFKRVSIKKSRRSENL